MDSQSLINTLTWALVTCGSGFLGSIVWFGLRIVAQLDRLEKLLVEEAHQLDRRILSLEDWRQTVFSRQNHNG